MGRGLARRYYRIASRIIIGGHRRSGNSGEGTWPANIRNMAPMRTCSARRLRQRSRRAGSVVGLSARPLSGIIPCQRAGVGARSCPCIPFANKLWSPISPTRSSSVMLWMWMPFWPTPTCASLSIGWRKRTPISPPPRQKATLIRLRLRARQVSDSRNRGHFRNRYRL